MEPGQIGVRGVPALCRVVVERGPVLAPVPTQSPLMVAKSVLVLQVT